MTCYFPDLVSDFDWLKLASSNQKHVVTRVMIGHDQYGISVHISQSSFRGETSGGFAIYRLFAQAIVKARQKRVKSFTVCQCFLKLSF